MAKMKMELRDQEVGLLQFRIKNGGNPLDRYIVVADDVIINEADADLTRLLTHKDATDQEMEALNLDEDNDKFWMIFNADCMFPPHYMVRATDESEATEVFLDKTDICTISEEDLPDYVHPDGEEVSGLFHADCGKNCDISQLQVHELELLVVITKEGIKAISGSLGHKDLPKMMPGRVKAPIRGNRVLDIT